MLMCGSTRCKLRKLYAFCADKSRKLLEASKLMRDCSKKDDLLVKLNSMKLKDSYVTYPWEQKMVSFLPVTGSAMVFSLLLMPPALSPKARDVASVENTTARAIAWLSAAQASGVPITFVNIQTEPLFMQVGGNYCEGPIGFQS